MTKEDYQYMLSIYDDAIREALYHRNTLRGFFIGTNFTESVGSKEY